MSLNLKKVTEINQLKPSFHYLCKGKYERFGSLFVSKFTEEAGIYSFYNQPQNIEYNFDDLTECYEVNEDVVRSNPQGENSQVPDSEGVSELL